MPNIHAAAAQRARDFRAVVGVAALPGSNPALLDFAANLSPATGLAFLLAPQPDLPSEALRQASRIPVTSIQDGMAVEPGRLHVTPPGAGVAIANRVLQLTPPAPQAPVDSFLRSLARDQQSRMVAVLLGHNASAGLLGLQTVRAQGGLCFTNDAEVAGGTADAALPPADIARGLGGIEGRLRREGVSLRAAQFQELSNLLSPAGLALGGYRSVWVQQRVDRRLALLGVAGLAEYFELLARNPEEPKALVRDIVNRHTGFFQNTEIFEALNNVILPEILKRAPAGAALRVWAPACGTGESAYSVGICVLEALGERASEVPVKIFATDADEAGLRQARAGIYPEGIALDVSPDRLGRFFEKVERGYVVSRQLRDLCLFARQDPLADAPLAGLDLIWAGAEPARWSASSRMRAATNFHYGLKPEGCLVLANAGALDPFPELFAPAAGTRGVLRKRTLPQAPRISPFWMESDERELRREVIRLLGDKYGVAGAVMDQNLNVLQLWGRPGPYLRLRRGPLGSTLNRAAFPAIHSAVAQAIRKAARHSSVQRARCQIRRAAGSRTVTIHATPLQTRSGAEPCFLVLVEKGHRRVVLSPAQETRNREILRLRLELAESRAHLESIIEEQESTNKLRIPVARKPRQNRG